MKRYVLINVLISVISSAAFIQKQAQAQDCPANPSIGTSCIETVTINLRALETFEVDTFNQRYEPDPGYKIVGHDVHVIAVTGNSAPPSVVKVQSGNTTATRSHIETAQRNISETVSRLSGQVQDPTGFANVAGEIRNKANSELSRISKFLSSSRTSNYGLDIKARAAAICDVQNVFTSSCLIWGPGGKVQARVNVRLAYVGTPSDVQAIVQKYVPELNNAAQQANTSRAYCSGASNSGAWVRWGTSTIDEACTSVGEKLRSLGTFPERQAQGFYSLSGTNRIKISCANNFVSFVEGIGADAFTKAVAQRQNYTCTFEVVN